MKTDESETCSTRVGELKSAAEKNTTWLSNALWWTKVAQVRFRFVLILVSAGLVVTQWAVVRNLWDRFVLRPIGLNAAACRPMWASVRRSNSALRSFGSR